MDDAAAVFWHGLTLLGQLIAPTDSSKLAPVANVLDGLSKYGQGSVDIWAARSAILTLTRTPIRDQLDSLWATVQGSAGSVSGMASGAVKVQTGVVAWCRFGYRAIVTITLAILKPILAGQAPTSQAVWRVFWSALYDLKANYTSIITDRNRMACGGLKLMFGMDNPWANVVYHQCASAAELTDGLFALLLSIFVDIPMVKCVCKDSAGQPIASFVTDVCAETLPASLRPTLFSIANQIRGSSAALACNSVLAFT
jgi:hypothetical protein